MNGDLPLQIHETVVNRADPLVLDQLDSSLAQEPPARQDTERSQDAQLQVAQHGGVLGDIAENITPVAVTGDRDIPHTICNGIDLVAADGGVISGHEARVSGHDDREQIGDHGISAIKTRSRVLRHLSLGPLLVEGYERAVWIDWLTLYERGSEAVLRVDGIVRGLDWFVSVAWRRLRRPEDIDDLALRSVRTHGYVLIW